MTRFALKSLLARKFRTILTALAIVLGVAMISGTYVLTDTIDKAFSSIFADSYAGTDAVVSGKEASFSADSAKPPPPPVRGVAPRRRPRARRRRAGDGRRLRRDDTKIIGRRRQGGRTRTARRASGSGSTPRPSTRASTRSTSSRAAGPRADGEVVVDAGTADDEDFKLGETIKISTLQPKQDFEVVGIAQYGNVESIGTATFAIFDIATAQKLFDREGQYDAISVAAAEGTTPESSSSTSSRSSRTTPR